LNRIGENHGFRSARWVTRRLRRCFHLPVDQCRLNDFLLTDLVIDHDGIRRTGESLVFGVKREVTGRVLIVVIVRVRFIRWIRRRRIGANTIDTNVGDCTIASGNDLRSFFR
jgi:hypothetical protein